MLKTIGLIILVLVVLIMFVSPLRDYCNNFLHRDRSELNEAQIIGTVSGYNPRVAEIQQILKDVNLNPGEVDGVMGDKTRRAIKAFQKTKGLRPTGKINQETQLALTREKENPTQVQKIVSEKTTAKSFKIKESKAPASIKEKSEVQDEIMSYRLQSKSRTKQIQTALNKAGFFKGDIDGKFGLQTKRAVRVFQKAKGLTADGIVGEKTWEELSKYLKE